MSSNDFIGATDAAKALGLSRPGFNVRVRNGDVMPVGRVGKRGTYGFDRAAIERMAEEEKAARWG